VKPWEKIAKRHQGPSAGLVNIKAVEIAYKAGQKGKVPAVKKKPEVVIDIKTLSDGDDWKAYYCRGHVDKEAFCKALGQRYGLENEPSPDKVEHTWGRFTPVVDRAYDSLFTQCDGPGRGIFPCTYYEQV
jgi:hypothetical protein